MSRITNSRGIKDLNTEAAVEKITGGIQVSVVIPVYNVEKYLEQCVSSILRQTYEGYEVILVDDGSTDNSGKLCDSFAKQDCRVHVVHKENGGLSSARNVGIRNSVGEYIVFIDSDDWVDSRYLETLLNEMTMDCQTDLVCCGRTIAKSNGEITVVSITETLSLRSDEAIERALFDKQVGIAAWGKLYKRSLFSSIEFPEGEIHEDVAVMHDIFMLCERIKVVSYAGYFYRVNLKGISKSSYSSKFDVVLTHDLRNEEVIVNKYPHLNDAVRAATASSCVDMMIKIIKSDNGINEFDRQLQLYQKELIKRRRSFFKCHQLSAKKKVWGMMLMYSNKLVFKLFKAAGKV